MTKPLPRSRLHTAFCTCGWWDLFPSEMSAQKAIDTHRNMTHHWDMRIVPPKGAVPKDPRHIR